VTGIRQEWSSGPGRGIPGCSALNGWLAAGSDCKHLYRRDRIERLGLRFPEDVTFGEDSMFATNYAERAKIGFVRNYCGYYERFRADGSNLTTWLVGSEKHLDALERAWQLRSDHQPHRRRDLLPRIVVLDLTRLVFSERFAGRDAEERRRLVQRAQALLATWLTPQATMRLQALDRLKLELIGRGMEAELAEVARRRRGKDVTIGGRVYGGYPYFQDPAVGIPDECYDVTAELGVRRYLAGLSWSGSRLRLTGHAYIEHVDTVAMSTVLVLRKRGNGNEHRIPVRQVPAAGLAEECGTEHYDYGLAGFDIELNLADIAGVTLSRGQWGVALGVTAQGVTKEVPLGRNRAPSIGRSIQSPGTEPFSAYFTRPRSPHSRRPRRGRRTGGLEIRRSRVRDQLPAPAATAGPAALRG